MRTSRWFRHRHPPWLRGTRRSSSPADPRTGTDARPACVIPVRSSVAPSPDPVQPTTPQPVRSIRSRTPPERRFIRELERCGNPSFAERLRQEVGQGSGSDRSVAHETHAGRGSRRTTDGRRQRRRLARKPRDDPAPARPTARGERRIEVGETERWHPGRVQRIPHRRGLTPERTDDRRHVGGVGGHLLGQLDRLSPGRPPCPGRRPRGSRGGRRGRPPP